MYYMLYKLYTITYTQSSFSHVTLYNIQYHHTVTGSKTVTIWSITIEPFSDQYCKLTSQCLYIKTVKYI